MRQRSVRIGAENGGIRLQVAIESASDLRTRKFFAFRWNRAINFPCPSFSINIIKWSLLTADTVPCGV